MKKNTTKTKLCKCTLQEPRQEETREQLFHILEDMAKAKENIGKSICELQNKEEEFTKAHKQILEQIKESYHTLDWISNLLLETAGRKDSESNRGLNPIIADICRNNEKIRNQGKDNLQERRI
ncbi:MAG: hypothetical protein QME12_09305 [Nanoarchaeota archaeon]|nr:hypothetical protein [Nanoarchaeota archaeon]